MTTRPSSTTTDPLDVVIVGGGITGLYLGHLLLKANPHIRFVILEGASKPGGRIATGRFAGIEVVHGAGIGRLHKDLLLQGLLTELGVGYQEFVTSRAIAKTVKPLDIMGAITRIRRSSYYLQNPHVSFAQAGKKVLGKNEYSAFCTATGYTDYEKEDVTDVLDNYGMDDNVEGWTGFYVPWRQLQDALVASVGSRKRLKVGCKVESVTVAKAAAYRVQCANGKEYYGKKVVFATNLTSLRSLLPRVRHYNHIIGQPFLRHYIQVDRASAAIMEKEVPVLTVVPAPLQKIIPMDSRRGIYMIAYADNNSAMQLKPFTKDTEKHRNYFARLAEKALGLSSALKIKKMAGFFWDVGTHAFGPLPSRFANRDVFIHEAQRPYPRQFVVGEVVSRHQGWVEGALESVGAVVQEILE